MATLIFEGARAERLHDETVLETLERVGQDVPSSCRSGSCQVCMLQVVRGVIPPEAQRGLKSTLAAKGCVLACQCRPQGDLELARPDRLAQRVSAVIVERTVLASEVLRIRLRPEGPFEYRPGQFLQLRRADGLTRSYSIASLPEQPSIELHIRRVPGGRMSTWLHEEIRPGDSIELLGPAGECFYVADRRDANLLLVGVGTGLAPLWGVARDALAQGHEGSITLIHGGLTRERLYYTGEAEALAAIHESLSYIPCALQGRIPPGMRRGAITEVALEELNRQGGDVAAKTRAYVCGDPPIVKDLRRALFLGGVGSKEIFADPFVMAPAGAALQAGGAT